MINYTSFKYNDTNFKLFLLGNDVTLIGWGSQVHRLLQTADLVKKKLNVNCEVIDLISLLPWDEETVIKVKYTDYYLLLLLLF